MTGPLRSQSAKDIPVESLNLRRLAVQRNVMTTEWLPRGSGSNDLQAEPGPTRLATSTVARSLKMHQLFSVLECEKFVHDSMAFTTYRPTVDPI